MNPRLAQAAVVVAIIGVISYFGFRPSHTPKQKMPGWEDLALCSIQTSFDATKTLWLNEDSTARVTDKHDKTLGKGKWSLLDAKAHVYSITAPGAEGTYVAVSPFDSDSCVLAAIEGNLNHANLRRSWFPEADPDR